MVSRGRPDALVRCLRGLSQLTYRPFEVVVVADPAGMQAVSAAPWAARARLVPFDIPNISAARNAGIEAAAGEIVAFIDDDAVPEPTWLTALAAPFAEPAVTVAGGPVRGRNGISWQWRARDILATGESVPRTEPGGVEILAGSAGRAPKTEGTNMAVRRQTLAAAGGFDPAFRFYLDEADLNLRLAAAGGLTAWVPAAEVHHGYLASDRRGADRTPRDLTQIGASLAAFLLRHAPRTDLAAAHASERLAQRRRLLGHMVAGRLEPRDVARLLAGFDAGWADGATRTPVPRPALAGAAGPFRPFLDGPPRPPRIMAGRSVRARAHLSRARAVAADGTPVSLFLFSPTLRYHTVRFDPAGVWIQQGGLFGRAERSEQVWKMWRFGSRLSKEAARVARVRGLALSDGSEMTERQKESD
ncbi:putative glycosyltransferase [Wenxinia marina DSM 24838]|uniref:Putative glycosyltransferase n=1 Tax=Wenxinia marina DSM 24838 TaxID=1123501 RepID=A0A0D0NRY0_9RHOB|nr:putative glycosyltransferase [Wenxinia marina DSM 24838]